jgi:heme/copper-type cytochrome/quinol oxidase subunit 3
VRLAIDDRRRAYDDKEERGTTLFMQLTLQLGLVFISMSIALYALSFSLPESHFALISSFYLVVGFIAIVISTLTARKQVKEADKQLKHMRDLTSEMEKKEGPTTDPVSVLTSLRP